MVVLKEWRELKDDFNDTLIVGNGGSMAVCSSFNYKDLYRYGCENRFVSETAQQIFNQFSKDDRDFERVLYRLWQTNFVNKALKVLDEELNKIDGAVADVRKALLHTVKGVHPLYKDIDLVKLMNIGSFAGKFSNVFSLNYDLTMHWAMTLSSKKSRVWFSDGFTIESKRKSAKKVKQKRFDELMPQRQSNNTKVFYPHGNLALYRNRLGAESRLVGESDGLLQALTRYWSKTGGPLFVCEGTTSKKQEAIQASQYLSFVFNKALPSSKDNITILGWGMGKQDSHILSQLALSNCKKIAVGVHTQNRIEKTIQNEIVRFSEALEPYVNLDNVTFFNSSGAGCWAN